MKTKLTKREKECRKAFNTLKKHNVSVFTLENKEFLEEWIFEQWEHNKLKPTPKNLKRVREKTMDYICSESWEIMQDAINYVAMKESMFK
jgi:hypothetical protein